MGTEEYSASLRRTIRQLQERSKIKDTLKPLPKRGTLVGKPSRGKRSAGQTTGIRSPITETPGTRTYHGGVRTITSSDGLFVLAYRNTYEIYTKDAADTPILFVYDNVS